MESSYLKLLKVLMPSELVSFTTPTSKSPRLAKKRSLSKKLRSVMQNNKPSMNLLLRKKEELTTPLKLSKARLDREVCSTDWPDPLPLRSMVILTLRRLCCSNSLEE
jgi:hypothetical protein